MQDEPDEYLETHVILHPTNPRRITYNKMMDLYISPSNSGSIICQDEDLRETTLSTTEMSGSIYGILK